MSVSTEQRVCRYLSRYLFKNIWNEPFKEFRTNAKLRLESKRAVGTFRTKYDLIDLPNRTEPFVMYSMPREQVSAFDLQCNVWKKMSSFNSEHLLDFQIFTSKGVWLWREAIYITQTSNQKAYFIAMSRTMVEAILGPTPDLSDMYVSKYYDSDLVEDLITTYKRVGSVADKFPLYKAMTAQGATSYVNGRWCQLSSMDDLKIGDYVEINRDGNVMSTITIDTTDPSTYFTYFSTNNSSWRTIVHVPKADNPTNAFVTWNTCDIVVRPKDDPLGGVFVHKLNRKWAFQQLTHSDFALDNILLSEFVDMFGTDELIIQVFIRAHNKNNVIIRDINYIDLLYVHDDATIIDFLQGKGPANFEFWTADHLEDSVYGKAMYDVPDYYNRKEIQYFVDTLGYYNTLSLICPRVKRISIDLRNQKGCWTIPVPMVFQETKLFAIVHYNGLKLPDSRVFCKTNNTLSCTIHVLDERGEVITCNKGDQVVIELFENPSLFVMEKDDIAEDNRSVNVPTEQVFVWKRATVGYARDINGDRVTTYGTNKLEGYGTVNQDPSGQWFINFNDTVYGEDLIITSGDGIIKLADLSFNITSEDFSIVTTGPLKLGSFSQYNYADTTEYLVYLNGKSLIEDLDYKVVKVTSGGNEVFTEIVLQNIGWLQVDNNTLEVYGVRGKMRGVATGFVSGSAVTEPGGAPFWFDNLSMLVANGDAVAELDSAFGQVFVVSKGHRNGSPYLIRTLVPAGAESILGDHQSTEDIDRLLRLRDYFVENQPFVPGLDPIPHSHNICSIFTNSIFRDYLNGTLAITYHEDPEIFLLQFYSYNWLKQHDVVFGEVDWDYVDAFPAYHRTTTDDAEVHRILQHVYRSAFPADIVKHRDSV